jgi:hypothetical protein
MDPTQLTLTVAGSLLYLFSRKERARRRNAQSEDFSPIQPPPAYKVEELGSPRGLHPQPRPLSSFAPDYARQTQYNQHQQHLSRPSSEQPPPYPTLPTYDPSRYQPIRPTSVVGDTNAYTYAYNPATQPGPSSRLSAVHYSDARLSTSRPLSIADQPPMGPRVPAASRPKRQPPPEVRQEGRERSVSEPMLSAQAAPRPKQPKPVLSRLITNFR